jgi:hypothetical protein
LCCGKSTWLKRSISEGAKEVQSFARCVDELHNEPCVADMLSVRMYTTGCIYELYIVEPCEDLLSPLFPAGAWGSWLGWQLRYFGFSNNELRWVVSCTVD